MKMVKESDNVLRDKSAVNTYVLRDLKVTMPWEKKGWSALNMKKVS